MDCYGLWFEGDAADCCNFEKLTRLFDAPEVTTQRTSDPERAREEEKTTEDRRNQDPCSIVHQEQQSVDVSPQRLSIPSCLVLFQHCKVTDFSGKTQTQALRSLFGKDFRRSA